jgi:hypothetical protein
LRANALPRLDINIRSAPQMREHDLIAQRLGAVEPVAGVS